MKKKPLFPGVTEAEMPVVVEAMNAGITAINALPSHLRLPAHKAYVTVLAEGIAKHAGPAIAISYLQSGITVLAQRMNRQAEAMTQASTAVKH